MRINALHPRNLLSSPGQRGEHVLRGEEIGRFVASAKTFRHPIRFEQCRFADAIEISDCTFHAPVAFLNCTFRTVPEIIRCEFSTLEIRDSEFVVHDEFSEAAISGTLLTAIRFDRCRFADSFTLLALAFHGEMSGSVEINGCSFPRECRLFLNDPKGQAYFNKCSFESYSKSRFELPPSLLPLHMNDCVLDGSLVVDSSSDEQHAHRDVVNIDFSGSMLGGIVDLRDSQLGWIHLDGVQIRSGGLWLPKGLTSQERLISGWGGQVLAEILRFSTYDGDRCGFVFREQLLSGHAWQNSCEFGLDYSDMKSSLELISSGNDDERMDWCHEIARQYSSLQSAMADTSSELEEDYCHYKKLAFAGKLCLAKAGRRCTWLSFGLIVLAILIGMTCVTKSHNLWTFCLAVIPLLVSAVLSKAHGRRPAAPFAATWDFVVLRQMFGYGVRLRRLFGTGAAAIVVFALVYAVFCYQDGDLGRVVHTAPDGQDANVVEKVSVSVGISRLLYFSTVSFTTLGYGDFRPTGRVMAFASLEALFGAFMMAMITVVFARRYLRL